MKKILCLALGLLMIAGAFVFVGCNKAGDEPLKLGLGVYTNMKSAGNANEDKNGEGKVEITAAAVTLDKDGKIVSCVIDTAENAVKYTAEGKAVATASFQTKYERGADYGMVQYGGGKVTKEWFEQVDAFVALVKGKTLAEVKALVVDGDKGNADVIAAGCTITVNEFVLAIEKACNNAVDSAATAESALKLGTHTEQKMTDATDEKNGENKVETTFFAAAVDAEGKIVAAATDCVEVKFAFDATGASKTDITKAVLSKREQGDDYGMVRYGGGKITKEWYAQADAFVATCIGKTAGDVAALMGSDNYGSADVKNAGCTILVNGFVGAASKAK